MISRTITYWELQHKGEYVYRSTSKKLIERLYEKGRGDQIVKFERIRKQINEDDFLNAESFCNARQRYSKTNNKAVKEELAL